MKLFIGNLSSSATEEDLRNAAAAFGEVTNVTIASGHGFVEMASAAEGQAALTGLNGQEIQGQAVKVSEARPEKRNLRGGGNQGQSFGNKGGFGSNRGGGLGPSTGSKGNFRKTTGNKV